MTESSIFTGLEPKAVLEHFYGLSQIPRPSGNQKAISDYSCIRSRSKSRKYYLHEKIGMICDLLGVKHRVGSDLPHWEYNVPDGIVARLRHDLPDSRFK